MPTIEVVSLGASQLNLNQSDFEVAIIEESKIESHRGLFNDLLISKEGVIVHLGNPDFKENKANGFFAGELIDWNFEPAIVEIPNIDKEETGSNQVSRFRFLVGYQIEVGQIIEKAIDASPEQKAYFLTDIQFGNDVREIKEMDLADFWALHDTTGLSWNTLYKLKKHERACILNPCCGTGSAYRGC